MQQLPPHVDVIKGAHDGPRVVVMGAVHGNERIGAEVLDVLRKEIKPENLFGELLLILGNPAAFEATKRFIDCDLNRLFGPSFALLQKKPVGALNTEEQRAIEIAPLLETADFLLDIHSTGKPSTPFVYCARTKPHDTLAQLFETNYIVSSDQFFHSPELESCTDTYVDHHGGIGITYESGWLKETAKLSEVMKKTYRFLRAVESLEHISNDFDTLSPSQHVEIFDALIPQSPQFHFTKDFNNFDVVHIGGIIAEDGNEVFKASDESFIIFPKVDFIIGSPACYLGRSMH